LKYSTDVCNKQLYWDIDKLIRVTLKLNSKVQHIDSDNIKGYIALYYYFIPENHPVLENNNEEGIYLYRNNKF